MSRSASSACPLDSANGAGQYSSSSSAHTISSRKGEDAFSLSSTETVRHCSWWQKRPPRRRHSRHRWGCSKQLARRQQLINDFPACRVDKRRKE
eukprot:1241209-Pleurochrysis_carterae.AAC.1